MPLPRWVQICARHHTTRCGRFIVDAILAVTIRDGVTAEVKKIGA